MFSALQKGDFGVISDLVLRQLIRGHISIPFFKLNKASLLHEILTNWIISGAYRVRGQNGTHRLFGSRIRLCHAQLPHIQEALYRNHYQK